MNINGITFNAIDLSDDFEHLTRSQRLLHIAPSKKSGIDVNLSKP